MNIDNNVRYQETDKKILHAYGVLAKKKPVEKITVSEICAEAGIHRTTFYGHYQDVIDLGDTVVMHQLSLFIDEYVLRDGFSFDKLIRAQMQFYYKNQEVIRSHLNQSKKDILAASTRRNVLSKDFEKEYMKCFNCKDSKEVMYHQMFFESGFTSVVGKWIKEGCKEPPEEISDVIIKIYRGSMAPLKEDD